MRLAKQKKTIEITFGMFETKGLGQKSFWDFPETFLACQKQTKSSDAKLLVGISYKNLISKLLTPKRSPYKTSINLTETFKPCYVFHLWYINQ